MVEARVTLREGERLLFAVGMGRTEKLRRLAEEELHTRNFDVEVAHTLHAWRKWIANCTYGGIYADQVERSALALKLMTLCADWCDCCGSDDLAPGGARWRAQLGLSLYLAGSDLYAVCF